MGSTFCTLVLYSPRVCRELGFIGVSDGKIHNILILKHLKRQKIEKSKEKIHKRASKIIQ